MHKGRGEEKAALELAAGGTGQGNCFKLALPELNKQAALNYDAARTWLPQLLQQEKEAQVGSRQLELTLEVVHSVPHMSNSNDVAPIAPVAPALLKICSAATRLMNKLRKGLPSRERGH